jgi:hypothetical protein
MPSIFHLSTLVPHAFVELCLLGIWQGITPDTPMIMSHYIDF